MPFIKIDRESNLELGRRVLISGPPNSRKTSSLHTWPRPISIMSYPGEEGHASIDVKQEGVTSYVWQLEDITKVSPHAIVKEVLDETKNIISGKYGPCETFAGDGLHKLYGWFYKRACVDLAAQGLPEEVAGARAYGIAHDDFTAYLTMVRRANINFVVFTVWEGMEKDDAEAKKGPSHIFPDLPGKMAKRVMGEFPVVIFSLVLPSTAPGKAGKGQWQLLPDGKVWGAGVKVPVRLASKLPMYIDQDFNTLVKTLEAADKATDPGVE